MKNKENATKLEVVPHEKQSTMVESEETLHAASQVLSKMYETEDETSESYLITHAVRLNNVAHSLVEEREKNYLEETGDENTRNIDIGTLEAICRLSSEARENMKLAMQIKKDKIDSVAKVISAMKGN